MDGVIAEMEPLQERLSSLRAREQILVQLLASFGRSTTGKTPQAVPIIGAVRDYVVERAEEVLRAHGGGPLHINEIHREFIARGYTVPGAGRPANLTAHLGRAPGILNPKRGMYAIQGGPSEGAAGEKKPSEQASRKRRRRKKRSGP
jgi:hypothetical protein